MTHFADRVIDLNNKEYFKIFEGLWRSEKPPLIQVGVIRNTNFTSTGEIDYSDIAYLNVEVNKFRERRLIKGDIIIERSGGGPKQPVGRVVKFNKTEGDFSFSNFTSMVRIQKPDLLFPQFAFYVLLEVYQSGKTKNIERRTTGIRNLDFSLYKKLAKFPLIPIFEQQYICNVLSAWDRAIERVQRLIEAKQQQKDQLVLQLLSGQKRFPGFQDEWKQVRLGTFLHPKFRKVVKPDGAYLRLGIRSHGKGTFTSVVDDPETIALTHLFQARKDDLIVNITFAWEGAIALVGPDGDGALVSHRFPTYVFDTSKMLPEYFKHLMVTDRFFYELVLISPGGAGRNRVMNKGDFLKITVTIPGVEEQKKIASVLGGMDEQIALLKKYLEKLKEQKKGLMQKLLTGEIRVKVN
ncbi:MAG: hypothetical protein CVU39_27050 [Chloroflexi bacterium HGW-Chloroflexi-10]|nr:MAG: hypothetical protein CVU39_27050 [Chloroflexi bacterium HGW-Chloroflexi-10]